MKLKFIYGKFETAVRGLTGVTHRDLVIDYVSS